MALALISKEGYTVIVRQLTAVLTHYRVRFHEIARDNLANEGITYELIYGQPTAEEEAKGDLAELDWGVRIENRHIRFGGRVLTWQPAWRALRSADLAILGQENRLLLNYPMQQLRRGSAPKIALWGHGRNFQSGARAGWRESWKSYWSTRCDWWFGYTQETRRILLARGFPDERITVFDNSCDATELRRLAATTSPDRLAQRRKELGLSSGPVGIFIGGLYGKKRLPFLLEAASLVRRAIPDFVLLIVGSGEAFEWLKHETADLPWIRVLGPRFGRDKVELMMLSQVFMMPGLLGLAIIDASAARLPVATTAFPYHSPEIAYLKNGENGLIVEDWQASSAYAHAVVALLRDPIRLARMANAADQIANTYTIERMAGLFAAGVRDALKVQRSASRRPSRLTDPPPIGRV